MSAVSPTLESSGLMKRGPVLPCSAMSPVFQKLTLQGCILCVSQAPYSYGWAMYAFSLIIYNGCLCLFGVVFGFCVVSGPVLGYLVCLISQKNLGSLEKWLIPWLRERSTKETRIFFIPGRNKFLTYVNLSKDHRIQLKCLSLVYVGIPQMHYRNKKMLVNLAVKNPKDV